MNAVEQKNVLIIYTDQLRRDVLGCYGGHEVLTPHIDSIAEEGLALDEFYTPSAVCTPSRGCFMTGRYPHASGAYRNGVPVGMQEHGFAEAFRLAGYQTGYIGKWHLASDGELEKPPTIDHTVTAIPRELRGGYSGFWRAADVLEFTSHGYDGYVFDENNNRIDFKGYRPDCITDMALEFFDTRDPGKPFFMTISQIEPHHQNDRQHYEGPAGSKEKYKKFILPKDLEVLGGNAAEEYPDYLGQCASLDENLGRIVARLKEKGLYDNTVIIFASDHGSHFKTRNTDSHLNGYDDYKRSCHDACLHVPLVIAGGPFRGGITIKELVSTESLPKTILALAGVEVGDRMIGENLLDVVEKKDDNRPNEVFAQISESRVGRCIRTPDFLYSVYAPGLNGGAAASSDTYADDFLYDMRTDPWQLCNVVSDPAYADVKADLRGRLLDWIERAEGMRPVITD